MKLISVIKLLEMASDINSPAFKNWFGNSKVVANGQPVVVYHATNKKFTRFSKKKTPGGITWFTSKRDEAEGGETGASGGGIIMELYVSIQNPAG